MQRYIKNDKTSPKHPEKHPKKPKNGKKNKKIKKTFIKNLQNQKKLVTLQRKSARPL